MVVACPEINSVKELKGKTVAVAAIGTANFAVLQLVAKHFGLDPEKQIKVLAVGPNQSRLTALKQGLVAAAIVAPRWDFMRRSWVFHVIARSHELFTYPQIGSDHGPMYWRTST
jgi:ABC-type taurine transport system substrate-binding protein